MKKIKIKAIGHKQGCIDLISEFGFVIEAGASTAHLILTAIKIAKEKTGCDEIYINRVEISTDGKTSALE